MPPSMAEARLQELLGFLDALKATSSSDDEFLEKHKALIERCLAQLANLPAVTLAEGTRMLGALRTAKLPVSLFQCMLEHVQAKLSAETEPVATKKNQMQKVPLAAYLTESEWKMLLAECSTLKLRLQCLSRRLILLGCTCPSEQTYVTGVGIALLSGHRGPADRFRVTPVSALTILGDFKSNLKASARHGVRSDVQSYPFVPAELPPAMLQKAYGDEGPTRCQLSEESLAAVVAALPARKTHTSVEATRSMSGKVLRKDDSVQHFLTRLALQSLSAGKSARQDDDVLPGLQILSGSSSKRSTPLGMLELEDGKAAEACPAAKTPRLAAEAAAAEPAEPAEQPAATEATAFVDDMTEKLLLQLKKKQPKKGQATEAAQEEQEDEQTTPKKENASKQDPSKQTTPAEKNNAAKKDPSKQATPTKKKDAAKKDPSKQTTPCAKKTKAAGKDPSPKTKKDFDLKQLRFPGTGQKDPQHFGQWTVYTCPNSSNWRLKKQGDKKDKAFSWKQDARAAWSRLVEHLKA